MLFYYLKADFKKIKGLKFCLAHILIPVCTAFVFLAYYSFVPGNIYSKTEAYFQVLAMAFPFLAGLFCAVLSEQELTAGSFYNMLAAPSRIMAFNSKLLVLLISGTAAVLLASVLFGAGYFFLIDKHILKFQSCFIAGLVLMAGNIFIYIFHLFLAMRFNKGVTTGIGIAESLLSAILLTKLGDNIWIYIPAAWASRFITILLRRTCGYGIINYAYTGCNMAVFICIVTTIAGFLLFSTWAFFWEGLRGSE